MITKLFNFFLALYLLTSISAKAFSTTQELAEIAVVRDNSMGWAVSLEKVGDSPLKTVSEYLALLNPNGSFSDTSSTIEIMTGRLLFMSQAFKNDATWQGDVYLKTNLYTALQYWFDHDPGNSGWTEGAFGEPRAMVSIGLCLYDAIQYDKTNSPGIAVQLDILLNEIIN